MSHEELGTPGTGNYLEVIRREEARLERIKAMEAEAVGLRLELESLRGPERRWWQIRLMHAAFAFYLAAVVVVGTWWVKTSDPTLGLLWALTVGVGGAGFKLWGEWEEFQRLR